MGWKLPTALGGSSDRRDRLKSVLQNWLSLFVDKNSRTGGASLVLGMFGIFAETAFATSVETSPAVIMTSLRRKSPARKLCEQSAKGRSRGGDNDINSHLSCGRERKSSDGGAHFFKAGQHTAPCHVGSCENPMATLPILS